METTSTGGLIAHLGEWRMASESGHPLCTRAPVSIEPATLAWSPNTCANAVWGLDNRRGYARFRTVDPVRMTTSPGHLSEVCTLHAGYPAARQDGYWEIVACGESSGHLPYSMVGRAWAPRAVPSALGTDVQEVDPTRALRPGYSYAVGSYPTPRWVESIFGSPLERCEGTIV